MLTGSSAARATCRTVSPAFLLSAVKLFPAEVLLGRDAIGIRQSVSH